MCCSLMLQPPCRRPARPAAGGKAARQRQQVHRGQDVPARHRDITAALDPCSYLLQGTSGKRRGRASQRASRWQHLRGNRYRHLLPDLLHQVPPDTCRRARARPAASGVGARGEERLDGATLCARQRPPPGEAALPAAGGGPQPRRRLAAGAIFVQLRIPCKAHLCQLATFWSACLGTAIVSYGYCVFCLFLTVGVTGTIPCRPCPRF